MIVNQTINTPSTAMRYSHASPNVDLDASPSSSPIVISDDDDHESVLLSAPFDRHQQSPNAITLFSFLHDHSLDTHPTLQNIQMDSINDTFCYAQYLSFNVIMMKRNGYINATKLAKDCGKQYRFWTQNASTKLLINTFSKEVSQWSILVAGGAKSGVGLQTRGSYIHPLLISSLMSWLSPSHALVVNRIINTVVSQCHVESSQFASFSIFSATEVPPSLPQLEPQCQDVAPQTIETQPIQNDCLDVDSTAALATTATTDNIAPNNFLCSIDVMVRDVSFESVIVPDCGKKTDYYPYFYTIANETLDPKTKAKKRASLASRMKRKHPNAELIAALSNTYEMNFKRYLKQHNFRFKHRNISGNDSVNLSDILHKYE